MKTKVSIIRDVAQSQIKKGETGYIDGYTTLEDTNVWTCEKCNEVVEGYNVTYSELHEGCGGKCS